MKTSIKFLAIFISLNVFVGAFALIVTSIVKDMDHISIVGVRLLFPLWFFGGAQAPWQAMYTFSPRLAYASLINPLLYALEGLHASVLGQQGYLPYWVCLSMLWVFILVCLWIGVRRLQTRLDCV